MFTSNSAHVGSTAHEAADAVDVSKEMLVEWLRHPVTKVLAIVIVAELVHRAVIHYGVKFLIGAEGKSIHADA
jgi:hypothetical protein